MKKEIRCIQGAELRAIPAKDGKPATLEGYAAVYNALSKPLPIEDSQGKRSYFREKIAPGAFALALQPDADVRALVNHDPNQLVGRTTAGTLQLSDDATGLRFVANVPDTQVGRDALISVGRKDMDGCSFGFRTIRDSWAKENGEAVRTLLELDVLDVGPVTFPAYEQTSVDVRSIQAEIAKLDTPDVKPTPDEMRSKARAAFDSEFRATMEYDDPSVIWACRSAIEYFRMAFDCAQGVVDTIASVTGGMTEQDQQAVDDCLGELENLIGKAKLCRTSLQGVGATEVDGDEANAMKADGELRDRLTEMARRGLDLPPALRMDASTSGYVETIPGADGKLREYVRKVDHDSTFEKVASSVLIRDANGKPLEGKELADAIAKMIGLKKSA